MLGASCISITHGCTIEAIQTTRRFASRADAKRPRIHPAASGESTRIAPTRAPLKTVEAVSPRLRRSTHGLSESVAADAQPVKRVVIRKPLPRLGAHRSPDKPQENL